MKISANPAVIILLMMELLRSVSVIIISLEIQIIPVNAFHAMKLVVAVLAHKSTLVLLAMTELLYKDLNAYVNQIISMIYPLKNA